MLSNNSVSHTILELASRKKITWEQKDFSQWVGAALEWRNGLKAMREIDREDSQEKKTKQNTDLNLVIQKSIRKIM